MASDAAPAPSALVDFVAGTAASVASLLAGHPFDTIKTSLQTQPHSLPQPATTTTVAAASSSTRSEARPLLASSSPATSANAPASTLPASSPRSIHHAAASAAAVDAASLRRLDGTVPIYRSATHAFRVIVKEEKLIGLYKGVTSPMLGVAVMNASIFGIYGLAMRFQQEHDLFPATPSCHSLANDKSMLQPSLMQIMVAGIVSGLGSSLITAPIDLIKIREQMDLSSSRKGLVSSGRRSTYRTLIHIVKTEGLFRGLFRGWGCTAVRDMGYGLYFWSYELMNRYLARRGSHASLDDGRQRQLSNLELAVSGGLAGVLAWLSTFWADVIKTKVQATTRFDDQKAHAAAAAAARNRGDATTASSMWTRSLFLRTAAETYRDGGVRAFFAGVGPTVLRAVPVNAVMFIVFESVKDALVIRGF